MQPSFHLEDAEQTMRNFLGQVTVGRFQVSFVLLMLTLMPLFLIMINSRQTKPAVSPYQEISL